MRMIDADGLERACEYAKKQTADCDSVTALDLLIAALRQAPTVDAAPVVRCKDCKYWEKGKDYEPYCNNWANMMTDTQAEDFCSYGERK